MSNRLVRLFLSVSIVALSLAAGGWLGGSDLRWDGWEPASCMPDDCFCEAVRDGSIRQPANTWSNLGFVLVGCFILGSASPRRTEGPRRTRRVGFDDGGTTAFYGLLVAFIGVTSGLFHASLTFLGQSLDILSMYLLPTFVGLYNVARAGRLGRRGLVGTYLVLNAALEWLIVAAPAVRRPLFGGLVLVAIASEVWVRKRIPSKMRTGYMTAALALFALAWGIWILDLARIVCVPESLVQGHAVWHLLGAASAGLVYLYYGSEETGATTD